MRRYNQAENIFWNGIDVLMQSDNPHGSIKYFDEVILLEAGHYWAHYFKGMALLLYVNDLKGAERCLKKVVQLHKTHAAAWANLAGVQEQLGKKRAARKSRKMAYLTTSKYADEIKKLNQKFLS